MNERIKELELQCYVTITKGGLDGCYEKTSTIFDKEKFAEYKGTERTAKAMAYSTFGTGPVQRFAKPLVLDLKGRTFQKVD